MNRNIFYNLLKFEEVRYRLLLSNFVVLELIRDIKSKYRKKTDTPEFHILIEKLSGLLNIEYETACALLKKRGIKVKPIRGRFVVVTDKGETIYQPGIYVRLNPYSSKTDWRDQFDLLRKFVKENQFNIYPMISPKDVLKYKSKNQIGYKDEQSFIRIYLQIENRLRKHWLEKIHPPAYREYMPDKKGSESVVLAAIESIILDKNYKSAATENKQRDKMKRIYYVVAQRYRLPTLIDLDRFRDHLFLG